MARPRGRQRAEREAIRAEVGRRTRRWILAAAGTAVLLGAVGLLLPDRSLQVISLVLGVYFVATGISRAGAAYDSDAPTARRVIVALLGAAVVGVGVLCLNHPFRDVPALDLLIGGGLLLDGLAGVGIGLLSRARAAGRAPVLTGALSIGAGIVIVITQPATLGALLTVVAICLLIIGLVTIVVVLLARGRTDAPHRARTGAAGHAALPAGRSALLGSRP